MHIHKLKATMKKTFAFILVLVITAMALVSCSSNKLVGSWSYETKIGAVSAKATYTFNEDNTGSITIIGGVSLNFNYELEGDQLTIKGNLSGYEGTYTYKVDSDKLSLTQNGTTITLVKNK